MHTVIGEGRPYCNCLCRGVSATAIGFPAADCESDSCEDAAPVRTSNVVVCGKRGFQWRKICGVMNILDSCLKTIDHC